MEIDLEPHAIRAATVRSEVCIVGAGIAGLTLAQRLSQQGIEVVVLEAGGRTLEDTGQALMAGAQLSGEPHLGTTEGRFRVLGGSSVRWGGQLLPLPWNFEVRCSPKGSLRSRSGASAMGVVDALPGAYMRQGLDSWPIPSAELEPLYRQAESLLGVDDLPYAAANFFRRSGIIPPALLGQFPELTATIAKWTPIPRRNLAERLGKTLLADDRISVYLHAPVAELLLAPDRTHLAAVLVRTRSGRLCRFEAEQYIVAAGTVETVRLLLASRRMAPEGVGNTHDQVGRNFHDHLTLAAATLTGPARAALVRELGFWVVGEGEGPTVHSAKLCASPQLRQQLGLNPVLAHLTLEEPEDSGLATVRSLLLTRQRGELRSGLAVHATHLPGAALEAIRLAWSAQVHHRRFVSARTAATLRLNAVQDAPSLSRITLSGKPGPDGCPQAHVDWRITPQEISTLRHFAQHLSERFAALPLEGFNWRPELFSQDAPLSGIEDARHAMGGACMGLDPRQSVVSPELQVHGLANLSIASAATFPNGGPPLPTLPLMMLSLRLADRIVRRLRR